MMLQTTTNVGPSLSSGTSRSSPSDASQQGASVGTMMNEGRGSGGQCRSGSNSNQQHCCCFGTNTSYHEPQHYQDPQHRGCHVANNLAYYQTYTPIQQNTWYNNNEYEHYANNLYDWNPDWNTSAAPGGNNSSAQGVEQSATTGNANNTATSTGAASVTSKSTATSPMWTSNDQYDYYSSYPTPPTPAGSTVSGMY